MEEEDRISELPDPVLEKILCLVSFKEAVRTSLLSKRWRMINVCSILSNINFNHSYFYSQVKQKNVRKKNRRLLRVVDKIILARSQSNLSVRELSLDLLWTDPGIKKSSLQPKIERWMRYLPKSLLTTLVFRMCSFDDDEGHYDLSLSTLVAAAQSLQNLFLVGFHLTFLSSCYNNVGFSALRSLQLWTVKMDNDMMQQLLKGCPFLEILEMEAVDDLKRLEVIGFSHLKKLVVNCNDLENLHIDVANLEVLELQLPDSLMNMVTCAPYLRHFEFKGTFELDSRLQLQGLHLPMDKWLSHFLSMCSLLEHLTLSWCPKLKKFHLSTPFLALKTLHLRRLQNLTSFKIVAPNLEKLLIDVNNWMMPFVEVDAASDKLEVEIIFYQLGQLDDLWYDRLAKSLGFFNHRRAIKLSSCHGNQGCFIPKEKRVMLHSPLYNTNYLELTLMRWGRKLFSEYLDYMLWLSPRATNLIIREDDEYCDDDNNTQIVLEFLYEEEKAITLAASSNCSCCKLLLPLKCWRHHLKEVHIRKFVGSEADKAAIKQFLWEEIENLGITETSLNPDSIYGGQYESYDQLFK